MLLSRGSHMIRTGMIICVAFFLLLGCSYHVSEDSNRDNRIDILKKYTHDGRMIYRKVDRDFDGEFDVITTMQRDGSKRSEFSTFNTGVIDAVKYWDPDGRLVREEYYTVSGKRRLYKMQRHTYNEKDQRIKTVIRRDGNQNGRLVDPDDFITIRSYQDGAAVLAETRHPKKKTLISRTDYKNGTRLLKQSDTNTDGTFDVSEHYYPNGRKQRIEKDRNFDGKIDYVQTFDLHGRVRLHKEDNNFNGKYNDDGDILKKTSYPKQKKTSR